MPSSNESANKRSVNDTNHPFESNFGDITKLQNSWCKLRHLSSLAFVHLFSVVNYS